MGKGKHEEIRFRVSNLICRKVEEIAAELRRLRGASPEVVPSPLVLAEELARECKEPNVSPLLLRQEVPLEGERRADILLAGRILLELKSREEEFEKALEKARREYLPGLPSVSYYIVTNWDRWEVYKVRREFMDTRGNKQSIELELLTEGTLRDVDVQLELIIRRGLHMGQVEEFSLRASMTPDAVVQLYKRDIEEMKDALREVLREAFQDDRVRPLFEAYASLMKKLYPYDDPDKLKELYIEHTLFHMMTVSSLAAALGVMGRSVDVASGATLPSGLAVALPYLNWWKIYYGKARAEEKQKIEEVATRIASRAALVDWSKGGEEEIFRALYESLLDPEDRRKLGEYYTPIWMVDRILSEFKLRDKVVLDPFCGSGTFLARAFYKKLREGEDPRSAYEGLLGFDVNPLAVAVARAVLIITYVKAEGRQPHASPRVYHFDTFAAWLGAESPSLREDEYLQAARALGDYIEARLMSVERRTRADTREVLRALSELEKALSIGIALYARQGSSPERELRELLSQLLACTGKISSIFREALENSDFAWRMAKLVEKYGDGIWAVVATSAVALRLLRQVAGPEIIVTNPPWIQLTAMRTDYAKKMREYVQGRLKKVRASEQKSRTITYGSDVSVVALGLAARMAREGVGFVMPSEQIFSSRLSVRAGIVASYAVLQDSCPDCGIKLIHVKYDAFGHGVEPTLAFIFKGRREGGLFVAELERSVAKGEDLSRAIWRETRLGSSYKEYLEPGLRWARSAREDIAAELSVKEVKIGGYVRGIAGGERKRGREPYAGLRVDKYEREGDRIRIRLANLKKEYSLPDRLATELMKRHGVGIYDLHYGALPYVPERIKVLLSTRGSRGLQEFISELVEQLQADPGGNLEEEDRERLLRLREELRAQLQEPVEGKPYVAYRNKGFLAAYVTMGRRGEAFSDRITLARCESEEQAYYYAAVLNYLAYHVILSERSFARDLYQKPLEVVARTGLSWKEVPEELRRRVAQLSRELEELAVGRELGSRGGSLRTLAEHARFQELMRALDEHIERRGGREQLEEALDLVSTRPRQRHGRE